VYASQIWATTPYYTKAKRWTVPFKNGCWQCWKGCWESETPRLHGVSCEIGTPTVQLVSCGNAAVQFFELHNEIGLTCWHAAEYRSKDCWSAHILSAMEDLTQSYIFKQKLRHCEPIDLSRFVVDLRERHLEYWTSYSETHPREHNSKRSTYHQWCALLTKKALVTHLPNILPKYMLNYLPRDVIRSTARFRLRVHTLRFETATWSQSNSPTCDLCDADDVQDEQHVFFHCTNPHVISLRRKYAPLFPPTGAHDVSTVLSQDNKKLCFFLHELFTFYEQASSRTSWLKAFFCKPCKPCYAQCQ